ncbi:acyl-CoA dehydrogenase family protein [Hyphomonas johnsonii]|uniref:Acyl-CoA dehydrogenase family protein n=1 Tax=Hyphomonas johnsonii MHS-2 TaxID=1280950 RepID=A0A059FS03_9PROT|nr:acyl-CoA dehydrogenase family protein [Hyphomonas johnsonii]KCZ93439.1 acyl-CoA dehydrogenase family protein [Hyphomonas johnsonii MHS-2]
MDGAGLTPPPAERDIAAGHVDQAFRSNVKAFLDDALTEALCQAGRQTTGLKSAPDACQIWRDKLHAQGWLAPTWPVEYGGAGWSTAQRLYFENACAQRDAPILQSSGIRTIGPLIIEDGTPAQKEHYLPAILCGEHEWCQGFSEPQAGSDLSALSLRAEQDGKDFVLTGSKLWTSFAQYATHMFLLARTDPRSRGGEGLVFLLVEMNRPGIQVRPIRFLDGECETNEVFFDKVRTPVSDRIGDIGEGWKTAKRLMSIARSNNTTTGVLRRAHRAAQREAAESGGTNSTVQARLLDLGRKIDDFEAFEMRIGAGQGAVAPAPATSALKLLATELHQAITEIGLMAAPHSDFAQAKYLATRAATIYSGTSEIHRNILARAIGCP